MNPIDKLLGLAGPALVDDKPGIDLIRRGPRAEELHSLLSARNGFMCFGSALHVLPSGEDERSLEWWNTHELWRDSYEGMADGFLFFAEDAFGNQFGIRDDRVFFFDAETADTDVVAGSLEEWSKTLLSDYEQITGYPLARSWQEKNGPLPANQRLVAKVPFVVGGQFDVSNLHALDAVKAMRFRGELARQIRDLPDGTPIKFEILP